MSVVFKIAFTRVGVAPEIANIVKSRFTAALANNMKDLDWSGIYEIIRRDAGLKKLTRFFYCNFAALHYYYYSKR